MKQKKPGKKDNTLYDFIVGNSAKGKTTVVENRLVFGWDQWSGDGMDHEEHELSFR